MTQKVIKKIILIIQAWVDGKTIQVWTNDTWIDEEYPSFFEELSQFRIKPEPKCRPFESLEECWQEMLKHQPFGWLIEKVNKKEMVHIGRIYDIPNNAFITLSIDEGHNYSSGHFFRTYTFADGTPFGIKLE